VAGVGVASAGLMGVRDLVQSEPATPAPFTGVAWFDQPFCGLDLETTGVDPETARVVTASFVTIERARIPTEGGGLSRKPVTRSWVADPDVEIPAEATAIHGYTTERAQAAGEHRVKVCGEIAGALAARPAGAAVVIFNARYDLTILDREMRRYQLGTLNDLGPLLVVDPLILDKHVHKYRKGSRKLIDAAAHYGAQLDDAHDADHDTLAACRLAWRICRDARIIRRTSAERDPLQTEWDHVRHDLPALHAAQAAWAADQAADLERYFTDSGQPRHVDREWPVVPIGSRKLCQLLLCNEVHSCG